MNNRRLFIVANRLPVKITEVNNNLLVEPTSGGLVTAINSYLKKTSGEFAETFWAGVPGCNATTWMRVEQNISADYTYLPVLVYKNQYDAYYNGFSNSVLWPLFHYFPSYAEYNLSEYEDYLNVNEHFCDTLMKHLRPTDTVWIHDYHLLPLAGMLRKKMQELTIGFFLHIPFPSFEIFRLLPRKWQEALLKGMLGADLVGFHTIDYASHFLQSVQKVLGLDNDLHTIRHDDRLIKIDVFPISIDYECFNNAFSNEAVSELRNSLRQKLKGKKIIFSVDRLDYTKGLHNRLKAYEYFLLQNRDYHEKVVFIITIVPSRDNISKYAERKRMIDESISRINGEVGNIHWQPVIYQYHTLSFEQMLGLYTAADVALITPLRDGMNLVAKEFVASRKDKQGVLVISEMAGASRELTDALSINPNDIAEMAEKIKEGLEMNWEEQQQRMETMQNRIASYDVKTWAEDFFTQLKVIKDRQQKYQVKFLDEYSKRHLYDSYRASDRRLFLFDYDGTLVPFAALPSEAKPGSHLLNLIRKLSSVPNNDVYIISGRNSNWLDQYFGMLPVNLLAEHGAKLKVKGEGWISEMKNGNEWQKPLLKIMDVYVRRCANTFIEVKDFSIVWHYRNANPDQAKLRSSELLTELHDYIHNLDLQVIMGNKIVEVRKHGINKGSAVEKIVFKNHYDFILAVGDDNTDEDMFKVLVNKPNTYTIKIGAEASFAGYNLSKQRMVISLLEGLAHYTHQAVV